MDLSVMFMDCPEFSDRHGTARCGLPAAVEYRYTVSSIDGLLESVKTPVPARSLVQRSSRGADLGETAKRGL